MLWTECENEKDDEDDEIAEDAEEDKDDEDDEDEDEEDADDNVDHHYYHNTLSRWNVFRPTIPLPKLNPCTRHGISNHWTLKSRALHQARLCSVQPNLPNFWNQFTCKPGRTLIIIVAAKSGHWQGYYGMLRHSVRHSSESIDCHAPHQLVLWVRSNS